jgi:hypothetical protein
VTHETFNLLLAALGLPAVAGGVAATQFLLVGRQAGSVADQMRKQFQQQPAAVQKWMHPDDDQHHTPDNDLVSTR